MSKEKIQNLIKELVEKILKTEADVEAIENYFKDQDDGFFFNIKVKDAYHLTKNDGEALMALNHVVRKIAENENKEGVEEVLNILIDVNDFQKKRIENIKNMAHMMGERARYFKASVEMEPMSSYERRIVHEFFSEVKDLETESVGFGKGRKIVIKYKGDL